MVSFQCEGCGDIVKKPKCKIHQQRCHAPFTCIDCHQTFPGTSYQPHNQCMTESQKYEKGYKPPTKKNNNNSNKPQQPESIIAQLAKKKEETNKRSLEESSEPVDKKKAKKDKKKKLTEWSLDELDSDINRQITLALEHVLKKDQITQSLETVREKIMQLISTHPKSSSKPADLKTKFDQLVGLSYSTKKNKIVFSWIKN
ncbi:hypothetical protein BC941DRAFT_136722 [Chlamydoabsidia padenii]|nr:hypothetical protein BC941DRAFT_136722 [Chlamydoabsidia padenii]